MSIQDELNQIKSAIYGADVRDAIHDSIKKTYDDASASGNANMEVELARGIEPTLNDRLGKMDDKDESLNAQLAQTATKAEVNSLIGNVSDGTPLFANGTSEMMETDRIYLNLEDKFLYVHDGASFVNTEVPYLSNSIEYYMYSEGEAW